MTSILAIQPMSTETVSEKPEHRKIRTLSRVLVIVFTIILSLVIAFDVALISAFLFYPGPNILLGPSGGAVLLPGDMPPPGMVPVSTLPLAYRLSMVIAGPLIFGPSLIALSHLRALFKLYAAGIVFARDNAMRIKRIGIWLIVYAFAPFVVNKLLVLIFGSAAVDRAWFHMDSVYALLLGAILMVIAQVMEFGREIEQEQAEFV